MSDINSIGGTVRSRAVSELRDRILTGRLRAGDRVDLDEIAREFRISRTPVREALLALSYEGLVQVSPRSGIRIIGITPEDAVDNFAVLAALAGKAAEWATARVTEAQLTELYALAAAIDDGDDDVVAANQRFHRAVNHASGSPRLLTYLRQAARVVPANYFELFPEQERRARTEHAAAARGDQPGRRRRGPDHRRGPRPRRRSRAGGLAAGPERGPRRSAQGSGGGAELSGARRPGPAATVGTSTTGARVGPAQRSAATARRARARKPSSFSSGVRIRVLRDMIDTSCPAAFLRSAPTVASSLGTWTKGSNEYQRMAFSWVILAMSSSETSLSTNTACSSSGAVGHIESLCG